MSDDSRAGLTVAAQIRELAEHRSGPLLVALDGRSGAGKSTLAAAVATVVDALVIDGDDFYAGGTEGEWDAMTTAQQSDHCIDWRRQRPVLEALSSGRAGSWRPYDWDADDGTLGNRHITVQPAAVVLLEGVYSARAELADLLGLRIMLDVAHPIRRDRLRRREGEHYRLEWASRWARAEDYYFREMMPPSAFDLVIRETD